VFDVLKHPAKLTLKHGDLFLSEGNTGKFGDMANIEIRAAHIGGDIIRGVGLDSKPKLWFRV
jgi:hypothetical protein